MNKTKIEYVNFTWNPVSGCLHGCPYCYAKGIVRRFAPKRWFAGHSGVSEFGHINVIDTPKYENGELCIYPYGFDPTFHRYRLNEPAKIKKTQNVFVCSMADLFGDWISEEWIEKVFAACKEAPQHRYLFLTKNPMRYINLSEKLPLDNNYWFGTTITKETDYYFFSDKHNTFLSIEPIQGAFHVCHDLKAKWVIIGAETGNRKDKIVPKRKWIEAIVENCRENKMPVFLKNNLKDIWKEPLIQETPWDIEWRPEEA